MNNLQNENITISVVIPTYFRSLELSNLLCSLLKQTEKPIEIIIVDDNTPDTSIKLTCEKYQNEFQEIGVHLLYVRNPKERSICIARNLGSKMAKGNVICFIDSDVTLAQNFLQEIQSSFKKYPKALGITGVQASLTGIKVDRFNTIKKLFCLLHISENSGKIFSGPANLDKEIECEWFEGNAMAFKDCLLKEFQFDEKLLKYSFLEDMLFTAQINKTYPNRLIMTPKAKYKHEPSNVGRMEELNDKEKRMQYLSYRKYVIVKIFGYKGLLIFGWQNFGIILIKIIFKVFRKNIIIYGI